MDFENVDPNTLDDSAREYLAALKGGDAGAKQLEKIWGMAKETSMGILAESAEMYAALQVADFWKAKRHAERIQQMNDLHLKGMAAVIGESKSTD